MDFMTNASARYEKMSKGQRAITDYIRENISEAAFLTAAKLGEKVGVSESTVVRYAVSLGYEGYPEMAKELSRVLKGRLTASERLEGAYGTGGKAPLPDQVLLSDIDKISDTIGMNDKAAFEAALDMIAGARHIYVVGVRQEAPLAGFLSFYLNMIRGHASLVQTSSMSEMFEQLMDAGQEDLVIGISFPTYSLRTLKALEFANTRSAQIIAITDGKYSPMNIYSSVNLFARCDGTSVVASLVAPMSLLNALVAGLCLRDVKAVDSRLQLLEDVWKDFQNYGPDEMEYRPQT